MPAGQWLAGCSDPAGVSPASTKPVTPPGAPLMGKGNHSQKNDKKNKKPKQDKTKAVVKK